MKTDGQWPTINKEALSSICRIKDKDQVEAAARVAVAQVRVDQVVEAAVEDAAPEAAAEAEAVPKPLVKAARRTAKSICPK